MRAFEAIDAEDVVNWVSRYLKLKAQELTKKRTPHRDYRSIAMELMYRYSKISQEEIGKRFGGLDYSAVNRERKRLRERMQLDRALRESAQAIDAMLIAKVRFDSMADPVNFQGKGYLK
jgi:chromosomal replication initiation ATPase DnaA